ncbi:hypothetical protein [Halorussus caseinilyticus]|uniref:Uncharacterized protein n=1 Tax=Halorussus caseinilyticus TaxID=3034025 RepID=A0ABD5WGN1_9EURY
MWVSPKTLLLLCCLLTASVVGGATPRETAARDKFPSECLDAPEVRPGETVGQVNSAMDIDVFQIPVTKGDVIEVNATVSAENATVKIDHEAAFSDAVVDVKNPSNDSLTDSPWSNWVELDHAGGSWNVVVEKSGFFCVELSRELDANTSAETPTTGRTPTRSEREGRTGRFRRTGPPPPDPAASWTPTATAFPTTRTGHRGIPASRTGATCTRPNGVPACRDSLRP